MSMSSQRDRSAHRSLLYCNTAGNSEKTEAKQAVSKTKMNRVRGASLTRRNASVTLLSLLAMIFSPEKNGRTAAWLKKSSRPAHMIFPSGTTSSF
jgi:hypothetical protein